MGFFVVEIFLIFSSFFSRGGRCIARPWARRWGGFLVVEIFLIFLFFDARLFFNSFFLLVLACIATRWDCLGVYPWR